MSIDYTYYYIAGGILGIITFVGACIIAWIIIVDIIYTSKVTAEYNKMYIYIIDTSNQSGNHQIQIEVGN